MQAYSVLMSVYHEENAEYFQTAIESMMNQTVKPQQIVIVEDGPLTPPLYRVLDHFTSAEPDLFTIVPLEKNGGLAAALNVGLRHCRNELVARMDSDDISVAERCEKQLLKFQQNPHLAIVGGNMAEFIGSPDHVISRREVPSDEAAILQFGRRRSPFNHPTVMYRRSAVLDFGGYNVERSRAQDYELFVSMLHNGYHAENLKETLVQFREDNDSVRRKKSWAHCKTHMNIVLEFYKKGYSSLGDLCYVFFGACAVYLMPAGMVQRLYKRFLRKEGETNEH